MNGQWWKKAAKVQTQERRLPVKQLRIAGAAVVCNLSLQVLFRIACLALDVYIAAKSEHGQQLSQKASALSLDQERLANNLVRFAPPLGFFFSGAMLIWIGDALGDAGWQEGRCEYAAPCCCIGLVWWSTLTGGGIAVSLGFLWLLHSVLSPSSTVMQAVPAANASVAAAAAAGTTAVHGISQVNFGLWAIIAGIFFLINGLILIDQVGMYEGRLRSVLCWTLVLGGGFTAAFAQLGLLSIVTGVSPLGFVLCLVSGGFILAFTVCLLDQGGWYEVAGYGTTGSLREATFFVFTMTGCLCLVYGLGGIGYLWWVRPTGTLS